MSEVGRAFNGTPLLGGGGGGGGVAPVIFRNETGLRVTVKKNEMWLINTHVFNLLSMFDSFTTMYIAPVVYSTIAKVPSTGFWSNNGLPEP